MLKPLVPKFHSDLSVRLRDIAEKQVPVKLKPILVGRTHPCYSSSPPHVTERMTRMANYCWCSQLRLVSAETESIRQ